MTSTKKKKPAVAKAAKKQPVTCTPGATANRYDMLDSNTPDDSKPSYSDVAKSNRVSDLPPSIPDQQKSQVNEPSLTALMAAIQGIGFRLDDQEEHLSSLDDKFDTMKSPSPHDSSTPDNQMSNQDDLGVENNSSPPNDQETSDNDDDDDTRSDTKVPPAPTSRRGDYRNNFRPPTSADSTQNYFNQNEFYVAISGNKIKYADMEKYILQKILLNDSAEALKKIYSSIVRMIAYGFSTQLSIMPAFKDLDRDTDFEKIFLGGLFSDNYDRAKTVFDQIGEIILDFLQNEQCFSEDKAPEAYTIIEANESLPGWFLLETLLKQRLPICGADVDDDLDEQRVNLVLQPNEPIRKFYVRTQKLYNEYRNHATDFTFIPAVKIMRKYLQQLSRCEAYRSTLSKYTDLLSEHISNFGLDNNLHQLSFNLKDVYDKLVKARVPTVPSQLVPNPTKDSTGDSMTIRKLKEQNVAYSSLIASFENDNIALNDVNENLDDDLGVYYNDPMICAKIHQRKKCSACLLGFHSDNDCFLRGDKFLPPGLRRRLKVFNQVHGDAPPPGHKIREWDPPLVPPIHKNPNDRKEPSDILHNSQRFTNPPRARPFNNSKTKSNVNAIRSMELNEGEYGDDTQQGYPTIDPSISALITNQATFEETIIINDTDDSNEMCICSLSSSSAYQHTDDYTSLLCNDFEKNFDVSTDHDTKQQLICSVNSNDSSQSPISDPLSDHGTITSDENGLSDDSNIDSHRNVPSINSQEYNTPSGESVTTSSNSVGTSNSPINTPFKLNKIARDYHNVFDNTPIQIQQSINRIHTKCNNEPNKAFFKHHATQIDELPHSKFQEFCKLTFHIDGGANCGSIKDKSLYYFFHESKGEIQTVAGNMVQSNGWGAILLQFGSSVHLVGPMYYFPTNPRNTFSPAVLLNYNIFQDATVSTNKSISFVSSKETVQQPVTVYNDLDFQTFTIMTLKPTRYIIASSQTDPSSTTLRRSVRLANKNQNHIPSSDDLNIKLSPVDYKICKDTMLTSDPLKNESFIVANDSSYLLNYRMARQQIPRIISKSTMLRIIELSVQLSSPLSPRESTIQTMNSVLGTSLRSSEGTYPSQQLKLQTLSMHPSNTELFLPIIANFSRSTIRTLTPHQQWILLHLGTMHASASSLQPLIKNDLLHDISPDLKDISTFDCTCWVCNLRKATKLPRGKLVDPTPLAPFQRLHVDFSFFSVVSIRGFTTALDVACASTSYPFGFPTKSKSPPIEILRWLIGTLRSMGYVVNFIRVDEGGELANSSSFAEFIFKSDCIMESTGAGNSTNNGKVERQNRTKADMIRAGLSSLHVMIKEDLPDDISIESFWCLAYCHANFIKRRLFHRLRKDTPHFLVSKKKPSARELVPLGSYMMVVHPNKNLLPKLSHQRATRVFFMGYSNHTKIRLYWDKTNPHMIKRSSNSIIEDVPTLLKLEKCFSSPHLNVNDSPRQRNDFSKDVIVTEDMIDVVDSPFNTDDIVKIKFPLPTSNDTLGFVFKSDLIVGLPYIQSVRNHSIAFKYLKPGTRSNMYILSIDNHDQLSAPAAASFIKDLRTQKHKYMIMELVKRASQDNITSLVSHRTIFDQVPSLIHTNPTIASTMHKPTEFTEFVSSAAKPPTPKSFFEALKSPFKNNWKAAAWKHFLSNKKIVTFSKPFPRVDLHKDTKIFRSLLVLEVKSTDVPGVWQLKIRHAIVGTPQEQYIDYQDSYAPTIDPTTVRIQICFTCHCNYTLGIIDVKNAFQNTIAPSTSRLYCTLPPTYLEWLKQVCNEIFDRDQQYIMQMLNSCQGTKDASSLFYKLMRKALEGYGFTRSTVDQAYFVKSLPGGHHVYASVATDDILVSFPSYQVFDDLKIYLQQYFELTIQTGQVLQFLGVRYIQSEHCITLDQAEYTFSLLEHYFGTDVDTVKTIRTPMRYDSEFERELFDALPLPPKALQYNVIKYKGAYRFWIGKLMFLSTQTRFDIGFAVQKLSEYNTGPTQPAFESIVRILRFLAGDVLRPLTYPKKRFDGNDRIAWYATPNDQKKELIIPNHPTLFFDAEFAREIATRHSYFCNIITIYNVAVLFKVKKSSSIMLHTTDSELKGGSAGVRQLLPIRRLFSFNGFPLPGPSTAFTDNAAVHAIIESNRMTPRCKHIDIPISFLHQEHNQSFKVNLIRTMVMLADMGTKANTPKYHKEFKYWASGSRYLPPDKSKHWDLLHMDLYELNYGSILTKWKK